MLDSGTLDLVDEIEIENPIKVSTSQHHLAVNTCSNGVVVFTRDGHRVLDPLSSFGVCSFAFHAIDASILAVGLDDGSAELWDITSNHKKSSIKNHTRDVSGICFGPVGLLFLSSHDTTASIAVLDEILVARSLVKLEGHKDFVTDIKSLGTNYCVTCSHDKTIKVWNCQTGTCLRTLSQHQDWVKVLATPLQQPIFASGAYDCSVIFWSSETFEVLHCVRLPHCPQSLIFGRNALLIGVVDHGMMVCNVVTGEIGPVVIPGTVSVFGLALSTPFFQLFLMFLFAYLLLFNYSARAQIMDFHRTYSVVLACTAQRAHGHFGVVEGACAGPADASTI